VLYKVTSKAVSSTTAAAGNGAGAPTGKKRATSTTEAHRTPRLVSFNTPQQSRTFWF